MSERPTCRAPHPDPRKPDELCGADLGAPADWTLISLTTRVPLPHERDPDFAYIRCARDHCKVWHVFRWREKKSA